MESELLAINALLHLDLSDEAIERLAAAVISGVLHAFDVDWAPKWVAPGEIHM